MNNAPPSCQKTVVFLLIGALATVALTRLLTLAAYPILDPTEGRYAEIPREMLASGDWVVPRLEHEFPFWGKPPLQFWLTLISYKVFGFNEFSARFPSFLLATFSAALIFLLARRLRGLAFALGTTLIAATTVLFYVYAGVVACDPALLATVTLSLVSVPMALSSKPGRESRIWGYGFFVGLGLSVLAKGLIGPILILFPVFLWVVWEKKWGQLNRGLPLLTGALLSLAIAVPWHFYCDARSPGFLEYYIVGEHWQRFTEDEWKGDRYGTPHDFPNGTIFLFFFLAGLPWTIVAPAALYHLRGRTSGLRNPFTDEYSSYFLMWMAAPLVVFTFSENIMYTYVLPSLPPFAILVSETISAAWKRSEKKKPPWVLRPSALFVTACFVPLLFSLASVTLVPWVATHKSQKILVEKFLELDSDRDAELVYTDRMPHSGDFYSSGRATDIADEDPLRIRNELDDLNQDYFAIEEDDLDEFPLEGLTLTTEIGKFGDYILRREWDLEDARHGASQE